jgi:hypothetical protein
LSVRRGARGLYPEYVEIGELIVFAQFQVAALTNSDPHSSVELDDSWVGGNRQGSEDPGDVFAVTVQLSFSVGKK